MNKTATGVFIGIGVAFLFLIILFFYLGTDKTTIAIISAFFSIIVIAIWPMLSRKKR